MIQQPSIRRRIGLASLLGAIAISALWVSPAAAIQWEPVEVVAPPVAFADPGALVTVGADTYIVGYTELDEEGTLRAFLRRTVGATTTTFPLFGNAGADTHSVSLASHGDNVDVVWIRDGRQGAKLRYRNSTDGGATWSTPIDLTAEGVVITRAQVDRWGANRVAVAWGDFRRAELRARFSVNGGETFGPTRVVEEDFVGQPDIAISSDNVNVTWIRVTNADPRGDLMVRLSSSEGRHWYRPKVLARNPVSDPQIEAQRHRFMIVYPRRSEGQTWISVHRSRLGGRWFATPVTEKTPMDYGQALVSVGGGVWRLAFIGCADPSCSRRRIHYTQSTSNGTEWTDPLANIVARGEPLGPGGVNATGDGPIVVWTADSGSGPQVLLRTGTP